jgi:hypothetical protein
VPETFLPVVRAGDLVLRIADGGMTWTVQPYAAVEIWSGVTYVGTLSGAALSLIVEHYLSTVAVQAAVTAHLDRPLPSWVPVVRRSPRKPPTPIIDKAARRARRRSRRRGETQ